MLAVAPKNHESVGLSNMPQLERPLLASNSQLPEELWKGMVIFGKASTYTLLVTFLAQMTLGVYEVMQSLVNSNSANTPDEYVGSSIPLLFYVFGGMFALSLIVSITLFSHPLNTFPALETKAAEVSNDAKQVLLQESIVNSNRARNKFRLFYHLALVDTVGVLVYSLLVDLTLGDWINYDAAVFNQTAFDANTTCGNEYSAFFEDYTRNALCPVGQTAIYANSTIFNAGINCVEVPEKYCQKEGHLYVPLLVLYGIATILLGRAAYQAKRYAQALNRTIEIDEEICRDADPEQRNTP